jgi:hypothetical protein
MPESEVPDGPGPDAKGAAVVGSDVDGGIGRDPVSDISRAHLQGGVFANEMAPCGGVCAGQQHVERHLVNAGIAVVGLTILKGERG